MFTHDPIYKLDTKGKTRVWYMERAEAAHRTVAGILGGNLVTSEWTFCTGKQGRSDEAQAAFEVEAAYANKLSREYHRTIEDASGGAHFFKPMLAQEFKSWQGPCFSQPKLDGARCIARLQADGSVGLFSRQGKPFVSVPHVAQALAPLFAKNPDMILDGELYNHVLRDDFGQIMSLIRQSKPTSDDIAQSARLIGYHVYDMPSHTGVFSERHDILNTIFGETLYDSSVVHLVPTSAADSQTLLNTLYTNYLFDGYEGQMVRLDAPYEQKRSKNLLKRKEFQTAEFPLLSIEEGQGNWSGVAKRAICALPDGRAFGAGIKGTRERAADLLHETWAQVTVRFFEYTPDGIPRFPVVIDFHNGRVD